MNKYKYKIQIIYAQISVKRVFWVEQLIHFIKYMLLHISIGNYNNYYMIYNFISFESQKGKLKSIWKSPIR